MISIGVCRGLGRPVLTLAGQQLSPRVLRTDEHGARIALVATSALLLAGDSVHIDIDVGPGCWLDVVDTAGTVAYHGRGAASSWTVTMRVRDSAVLTWHAEPFVVAQGAEVRRHTGLDVGATGRACIRESLVLGRSGEIGGRLDATSSVTHAGHPLLEERLDLTDPGSRSLPGLLGDTTIVDSVLLVGARAEPLPPARGYALAGTGTVARYLGTELHRSPLAATFDAWRSLIQMPAAAVPEAAQL